MWPWNEELKLGDAFRAPLQEVFRLLETIRNHQQAEKLVCFEFGLGILLLLRIQSVDLWLFCFPK